MARSRYRRGGSWPYNTRRWLQLREKIITDRGAACEDCGRDGRLDIHHVEGLTDRDREERNERAGFPDPAKLRLLCASCHSMVTLGIPEGERNRRRDWRQFIDGGLT